MNNSRLVMRVIERITKLCRPAGNLFGLENFLLLLGPEIGQGIPIYVLHRDAGGCLVEHEVVNTNNILVGELETALGLALQLAQQRTIVDNGIADYYTPTIIASPKEIQQKSDLLTRFMKATAQGYDYARTHVAASAQILMQQAPKGTFPDAQYVVESQQYLSPRYADTGRQWGLQDATAWEGYPEFMLSHGGVKDASGKTVTQMDLSALYTNKFLP